MFDWKPIEARLTLFQNPATPAGAPSAAEVYKSIQKAEPVSFQRSENPVMPSMARGRADGSDVVCTASPARTDIQFIPTGNPQAIAAGTLALITDVAKLFDLLRKSAERLAEGEIKIPVSRVAFNVKFVEPREKFEETNAELMKYMPEKYRPELSNEQDFIFQVNNIKESFAGDKSYSCNLITKWTVERIQVISFQFQAPGFPANVNTLHRPSQKEYKIAALAFDWNNVPTQAVLDSSTQSQLLLNGINLIRSEPVLLLK